jgi:hypothetical protein
MFRLILAALLAVGCTVELDYQTPDEQSPVQPTESDNTMLDSAGRSKTGGWSQTGTLIVGDKLKEARLQANFPVAEYYTCQFNVEQPADNTPDIVADVSWTVEGNTVRRRISVGNGTSISGTGAAMNVVARDATLLGPLGATYNVGIQCSRGTRPNPGQPVFLRAVPSPGATDPYLLNIPAGGSGDIAIPNDAGVISADVEFVSRANPATVTPTQVIVEQTDATVADLFKAYYPMVEPGFVPVFPTAANLHIVNRSADAISVFVLFGIDG